MKLSLSIVCALVCAVVTASDVTYVWDAARPATQLGDDVTVVLDGGAVASMTFANAAERTVRLTGDPVAFAADARLVGSQGTAVFANGLAAAGALDVSVPPDFRAWRVTGGSLYQGTGTVLFRDCDLSRWEILSAHLNGNFSDTATAFFQSASDGVLTAQMQKLNGSNTKCVAICLRQVGADVAGEILWAKYLPGDHVGIDFAADPPGVVSYPVPTSGWDFETQLRYYGCDSITLRHFSEGEDSPRRIEVCGDLAAAGTVTIGTNVTLAAVGSGALPPADRLVVNGTLELRDRGDLTLTGTLRGAGGALSVVNTATAGGPVAVDYAQVVPAEWVTLAENASLSGLSLASISGKLAGASLSTKPVDAVVCRLSVAADGQTASCQLQFRSPNSSNVKGCGLEFRQNGANVEFHAAFARYLAGESGEVDLSAGTDRQIATAADVKDYCVTEFHCTLDARAPSMKVTLDEGFAFATPGIALSVCGTANAPAELELKSATGFPPDGTVDVLAGGVLRLSLTQTLSSGDGALTVHEGGKLLQMGLGSSSALNVFTGVRRPIVADGGEVSFGCAPAGTSGGNDAVDVGGSTYLNAFTMRNGAVYTGKAVRVGNVDPIVPCRWCVDGTVPETFGQSISLLGRGGDRTVELTFDIADVTGDAATDFTFGGDIRIFKNRDYQNVTVVKTGAGTMRIDGLTDYTRNPTQVRGGMWMLGGSDTMNADQSIVLDGGSLGTAEGTANALKDLTVLQDATIVLKRGSSLSFGDCSTMEWESALIDVEGDLSTSQLRFGTSAAALTAAQQRMFRHHGQRMRLRADGVLEAYADGLKILYR